MDHPNIWLENLLKEIPENEGISLGGLVLDTGWGMPGF